MSIHIGIIGGGPSAVCLLDALALQDLPPGKVSVYEPAPATWRGRPYQPDSESLQVNAPPTDMSVRRGDSDHFRRWVCSWQLVPQSITRYVDPFSGVQYMPRAVYGDYLEQSARSALTTLALDGWDIELIREPVQSAELSPDGVALITSSGFAHVDCAVLCVGSGPPADHHGLNGTEGFIADPYPVSRNLDHIDPAVDVGIIGSGLTAVDAVIALTRAGHRGRIRLLSRSGVLPALRQRPTPYTLQHFTGQKFRALHRAGARYSLRQVMDVMRTELSAAGEDINAIAAEISSVGTEDPVHRLRRHLRDVDAPGRGLRILQQAVPEVGPDVWPVLSETEKASFLARHYRTVMSLCCPMPGSHAARLLSLLDSGQLEITSGLRRIIPDRRHGFTVTAGASPLSIPVLVNATNPAEQRIHPKARAVVDRLVECGAELHPRAGLAVERATSQVIVAGRPDPRLYALGDLASGTLFFTFGMQSLVDRAADIVDTLAVDPRIGARPSELVCASDAV